MNKDLKAFFAKVDNKISDLKNITLATNKGQSLYSHNYGGVDTDYNYERIATIVSSLASLSSAACHQIMKSDQVFTTMEATNGTLLFVKTKYQKKECVLSILIGNKQNLGQARFFSQQLAKTIRQEFK